MIELARVARVFIPISLVLAVLLMALMVGVKIAEITKDAAIPKDYRIYPDHRRWTRTELIALAGLLVAILGLVVAVLRR
jgi:hypothetical protein